MGQILFLSMVWPATVCTSSPSLVVSSAELHLIGMEDVGFFGNGWGR